MPIHLTLSGEQDIPPSLRVWARIVRVGAADVLELRDPNDGAGSDPATKSRHQYLYAGGQLWRRHLPPAPLDIAPDDESHDAWRDAGVPRWEPCERQGGTPRSVIDEYAEQMAAAPRRHGVAVVRRLPFHGGAEPEYRIGGRSVEAAGRDVTIVAGPITWAWYEVPLPPCPDCGGELVWAEAGYVPGARECTACRSMFTVGAESTAEARR